MSSKVVGESEVEAEKVQPSTSIGGGQQEGQQEEKTEEGEESFDSDVVNEEFLDEYCEEVEFIQPMTVSKELFYSDKMVAERYAKLSPADKSRFDQMKKLAMAIKQETGEYQLIEDVKKVKVQMGASS